jgi:chromosome segregation ATPase
LEAAVKAKEEQTKLASERQSELEAAVKAKEEQTKLASERQSELEAALKAKEEQTKLASERQTTLEALRKELEASKASGAEVEKKRAEVAGQLDVRSKERDQARMERDNLTKERDTVKKTASDRATRIAALEAQIADQAERQKQIDEQMVRAETQLEMLKEFLQPAFQ